MAPLTNTATRTVLVTVDATDETLHRYVTHCTPDLLQLHGQESPARCAELRQRLDTSVIKAAGIASTADLEALSTYAGHVDYLLLDSRRADGSSGGTGQPFNWALLADMSLPCPWFLSGGLGADNISEALTTTRAHYIDVSSRLEHRKGVKSPEQIKHFMSQIITL
jgi:phosphoribosylanthranilate isomerase